MYIWSFLCLFVIFSIPIHSLFHPACDLHENPRYGYATPKQVLPLEGTSDWLHADMEDIIKWYKKGKNECEKFLNRKRRMFSTEHAPYYVNLETMNRPNILCNGYNSLFDLTGMMVWTFGPYASCPTYSKCWFGLLTCGEYKYDNVEKTVLPHFENTFRGFNLSFPDISFSKKWSIRSLYMQMRFIGQELITPEQRFYSVPVESITGKPSFEDIIIAQYVTTISNDNFTRITNDIKTRHLSTIEIRHVEFYPSIFFPWSNELLTQLDLINIGVIYLGGNQGRCRPFMKCPYSNNCCNCDMKSFVLNSPLLVDVPNHSEQNCPALFKDSKRKVLPICQGKNQPGRWIRASYSPIIPKETPNTLNIPAKLPPLRFDSHSARRKSNQGKRFLTTVDHQDNIITMNNASFQSYSFQQCDPSNSYNIFDFPPIPTATVPLPPLTPKSNHNNKQQQSVRKPLPWYEASGNPCLFDHNDAKEYGGSGHWFYAPYACKYHFYERQEAYDCFKALNITHIHIHGDSMAREFFHILSKYLGIGGMTKESDLKDLTNRLKKQRLEFYSDGGVLLTQGYAWGYDENVIQLINQPPYPNVIISNTGLAHRLDLQPFFVARYNKTEKPFWSTYHQNHQHKSDDKMSTSHRRVYKFFVNMREVQGKRNFNFISNMMRRNSEFVKEFLTEEIGFEELDEYLLTMGRIELQNPHFDGFHFMHGARQMEVMVLMNMICNKDWLVSKIRT